MLLVLSSVMSACSQSVDNLEGSDEERAYDVLQCSANWEQIVQKYQKEPTQSLACRKVALLAMYQLGRAGREIVYECLSDSHDVLTSETAAMMMSDVYIQLGMVNMAQRAAFEAMVKKTDISKCSRQLRRLIETALITGQYDVARKYISILENDTKHRDWARSMLRIVDNPELIIEQPVYQRIRNSYENTEDQFFM